MNAAFINFDYFFTKLHNAIFRGGDADLLGFFESPGVRTFGSLFIVLFIILITYVSWRLWEFYDDEKDLFEQYFVRETVETKKNMRWEKVRELFSSEDPEKWRIAVIEADSMLEEHMIRLGFKGSSLGEKLKNLRPATFPPLQRAWNAHLLRNKIAHEGLSFKVTRDMASAAFRDFEAVFRFLGLM